MNDTTTEQKTMIERLYEAGAHFGFSRSRRHPSVSQYLFGTKNGTDIFDLEKTEELLKEATSFISSLGKEGKQVLFVGTKEEAATLVRQSADSLSMPYVVHRWIGGTITNFAEIKKRIARLLELKEQKESGELERKYTKKERLMISREIEKLELNFGGLTSLEKLPAALVVVDPRHESIAVLEARAHNIPVVAVMSSDCDASLVTHPIVVNDAHQKSVALILKEITNAYQETA